MGSVIIIVIIMRGSRGDFHGLIRLLAIITLPFGSLAVWV